MSATLSAPFVLRDASQAMVTHFAVTISNVWARKAGAVSAQKVKILVANYADLQRQFAQAGEVHVSGGNEGRADQFIRSVGLLKSR